MQRGKKEQKRKQEKAKYRNKSNEKQEQFILFRRNFKKIEKRRGTRSRSNKYNIFKLKNEADNSRSREGRRGRLKCRTRKVPDWSTDRVNFEVPKSREQQQVQKEVPRWTTNKKTKEEEGSTNNKSRNKYKRKMERKRIGRRGAQQEAGRGKEVPNNKSRNNYNSKKELKYQRKKEKEKRSKK